MFTLPPRPPKGYILKKVQKNQASTDLLTPSAYPRATQTSIAQYCYPEPVNDDEPIDKTAIQEVSDSVLNNWTNLCKAWRIDAPNKNDYLIHDIHKKFSVKVDDDYNPQYKHRPKIFQRSYKYEFDCMEEYRLNKLINKIKREEIEDNRIKNAGQESHHKEYEVVCKPEPPFWWKDENLSQYLPIKHEKTETCKTVYQLSYQRWQKTPKLSPFKHDDFCNRRNALLKFKQPFKHEACTWYFNKYPPPNIKFVPQKFAK